MDAHQRARRRLLAKLRDGDPCCRCHQPMYRAQAADLDADHYTRPAVLNPGAEPDALSHKSCNRRHGALLRLHLAGLVPSGPPAAPRADPVVTSRDW